MKRRGLAAVLACAMLVGCGAAPAEPPAEEAKADGPVIAYVPLDDRPDNVERVVYLANSLNYRLELPEEDWYQTKLDGQPLNENGTQYGDRAKLYEWVLEQEEKGCDRYVLSMDQLLSGGLVNSRAMSRHEDVVFRDETTGTPMTWSVSSGGELEWHAGTAPETVWSEFELLGNLLTTLTADPDNRVWLLDTVMRLAPTCGYDGFGLEEYNRLREYGMQPRPELAGEELRLERVLELYGTDRTGELFAAGDFGLAGETVAGYLAARTRKLELSDQLLRTLGQLGNEANPGTDGGRFRVLIGIDDSSEEDSIQKNEIAYLRSLLREGDALLSGVDDLAFKAVTRLYLDECEAAGTLEPAKLYVDYFGGTEDQPACAYDSQPLEVIVGEHLEFFGMEKAETREEADLQMLVLTQPQEDAKAEGYYRELIAALKEHADLPTILMDAANNRYGAAFHDALTKEAGLGQLLSYAGFLDMAIVTGTALSHGAARYAWLAQGNGGDAATDRAFQKTVAEAVLLDFCYRNTVREELSAYVREQGGDPNNFYAPVIDPEAARERLEAGMKQSTKEALKNLEKSNLIVSLEDFSASGGKEGLMGWGTVDLANWRFPWQRVFEVRMDMTLEALRPPH